MGPEFEWQIGNDQGQYIEVKIPSPRLPSPRQKIFVALAVSLGVCPGVIFASIPELLKRPRPTPLPTPTTPPRTLTPLEATIDREAQDLDDPSWHPQRFQSGYWA